MLQNGLLPFLNFKKQEFYVIEFSSFKVEPEMLKEIYKLIHLRYLGLRGTKTSILPNSIGNLWSLQTLDLRDNGDIFLPEGLSRLTCLTHLLTPTLAFYHNLSIVEHLSHEFIVQIPFSLIRYEALAKLANLQKLKLSLFQEKEVKMVLQSPIIKSGYFRVLDVGFWNGSYPLPCLESLSSCHTLYKLCLHGEIDQEDIHSNCHQHSLKFLPASLAKLTLTSSSINGDPMPVLEKLPNLRFLELSNGACYGSEMVCSAGGFPMLESLEIYELQSLREWRIEKNAMPSLKRIVIKEIP